MIGRAPPKHRLLHVAWRVPLSNVAGGAPLPPPIPSIFFPRKIGLIFMEALAHRYFLHSRFLVRSRLSSLFCVSFAYFGTIFLPAKFMMSLRKAIEILMLCYVYFR